MILEFQVASGGSHRSQNKRAVLTWHSVKVTMMNQTSRFSQPSVIRRSVTAKDTLLNSTWRTDVVPLIPPVIDRYFSFSPGTASVCSPYPIKTEVVVKTVFMKSRAFVMKLC